MTAAAELAVVDVASVQLAREVGADRIEVCAALEIGGVTPGPGFLREAVALCSGGGPEVVALIRPRAGDFVPTDREFRVLVAEVEAAARAGARGVAVGVLDAEGLPAPARTRDLVAAARPMLVTFHRAFDHASRWDEAADRLVEAGVARLLTSGGARSAAAGAARIREIEGRIGARIEVIAAAGVTGENAAAVLATTGAAAIHGSCGVDVPVAQRDAVPLGVADDRPRRTLDAVSARAFVEAAHAVPPRNPAALP